MLLRKLFTLFPRNANKTSRNFKILGMSREIGGVNFSPDGIIQMGVASNQPTNMDIELFIGERLSKLGKNVPDFDIVKEEVRQILVKGAEGTFLWIGLLMQDLERSDLETAAEVRDFIPSVPSGLKPLYSRLLGDVDIKTRSFLCDVLRWILVARRPLSIRELSGVLDQKGSGALTPEMVLQGLLRRCRNFLRTTDGKQVV
jgi:hypothetical protein